MADFDPAIFLKEADTPPQQTPEQNHRDEVLANIMTFPADQSLAIMTAADKLFDVVMNTGGMLHAFVLVAAEIAAAQSVAGSEAPRIELIQPAKIVT